MIFCSACGQGFSVMGYTQHIYSTSCTACVEAHEQNLEQVNSKERSQPADLFAKYVDGYEDGFKDAEYND
jgi:transcription elongation factor Elf1